MATRIKRGQLGDVRIDPDPRGTVTIRDLRASRWPRLARRLARREARALERLAGIDGVPVLVALEPGRLVRTFLPGAAMHEGPPPDAKYFRKARQLLHRMHRRGVTHNDLAKEANWIRRTDGCPGIVDFQLAICFSRRSAAFRLLAREDLRHLLKHKRHYRPETLTTRERTILATPAWTARSWQRVVKPVYRLITRRLLGWPERQGAAERQRSG